MLHGHAFKILLLHSLYARITYAFIEEEEEEGPLPWCRPSKGSPPPPLMQIST